MTEYGHNFWSRNRYWAYNIPNRSTHQALQIWQVETQQPNFLGRNSLVFISFGEKNRRTVTEYGDNFWSRNRCWAYNIPNRSTHQALQIWRVETQQPNFLCRNSLVFISFGGKKIGKLWLNTAINFDPEIVAGPIIYQIKALFKLYKSGVAKHNNQIF